MTRPPHVLAPRVLAIACAAALAFAGVAEARVHHHHHHAAAAASGAASGHHHRRHAAAVTCGRHHRHCHATVGAGRHRHAVAPPTPDEGNGMCKSVYIHGQWVQRCNFPDQGQ